MLVCDVCCSWEGAELFAAMPDGDEEEEEDFSPPTEVAEDGRSPSLLGVAEEGGSPSLLEGVAEVDGDSPLVSPPLLSSFSSSAYLPYSSGYFSKHSCIALKLGMQSMPLSSSSL